MRYRRPRASTLADYLTDEENARLDARRATDRMKDKRARSNAWQLHRQTGAMGRITALCEGALGASVLLPEYRCTKQCSALIANASRRERARFTSCIERHDLSGEVIGVRVTLVGFDDSSGES